MKITEIKEYHKNPRKISAERFDHLASSLKKLGDLGGVVVEVKSKQIIGGNQRIKSFLRERDLYTIEYVKQFNPALPDGTVAYGYVVKNQGTSEEQKFSYREVDWTEEQMEEANIVANKITGMWDYDMLANKFDVDKLLNLGFSQQDLDLLPKAPDVKMDNDNLSKTMDSYLTGNIKQIVLFFKSEEFDGIMARFDRLMKHYGVESHTEAVINMLNDWENANPDTSKPGD